MFYRFLALLAQDPSPILGLPDAGAGVVAEVVDAAAAPVEAAATTAAAGGGLFGGGIIWVVYAVILVGMYFLMLRPQRKRDKEMKQMQAAIRVGDNVVTSSGMYGKVADVGEDCFVIEFGTNRGIRVPVRKTDVLGVKDPKLTPPPKVG